MQFWTENKIDKEFSWPVQAVADAYCTAVVRQPWKERQENWPLDRALREWLTNPIGFNASWEDESEYEELLSTVRQQLGLAR
jgi:hypothetical protein